MQAALNFQKRTLYRDLNTVPTEPLAISSLHLISISTLILFVHGLLRLVRRLTSIQCSRRPLVWLHTKLFCSYGL